MSICTSPAGSLEDRSGTQTTYTFLISNVPVNSASVPPSSSVQNGLFVVVLIFLTANLICTPSFVPTFVQVKFSRLACSVPLMVHSSTGILSAKGQLVVMVPVLPVPSVRVHEGWPVHVNAHSVTKPVGSVAHPLKAGVTPRDADAVLAVVPFRVALLHSHPSDGHFNFVTVVFFPSNAVLTGAQVWATAIGVATPTAQATATRATASLRVGTGFNICILHWLSLVVNLINRPSTTNSGRRAPLSMRGSCEPSIVPIACLGRRRQRFGRPAKRLVHATVRSSRHPPSWVKIGAAMRPKVSQRGSVPALVPTQPT
jgi:hypothetical protein